MAESRKKPSGGKRSVNEKQRQSEALIRANLDDCLRHEAVCAAREGISPEEYRRQWQRLLASPDHSQHIVQFKGSDRSPGDSDKA